MSDEQKPDPSRPLLGRVAVVTGAGRGIGASTAAHLGKRGARVVLAARTEADLLKVAAALDELEADALPVVCDVTEPEQVERLFRECQERFGPVDILVNNAGYLSTAPLQELDAAEWDRMLAVNLSGVFLCCKAALGQMRPREAGVIVNVASVSGVSGVEKFPGLVAYAATKGGLLAFSEALASEQREAGIRVVAVSPGCVKTPMLAKVAPDAMEGAMTPGKVGQVIAWLATDEAAAVTNTNLLVWGPPGP